VREGLTRMELPSGFADRMAELYGQCGREWAEVELPATVALLANRWDLAVEAPFPDANYNFVAPAVRATGERVVLKIGYPDGEYNPDLYSEYYTLNAYAGAGMVRVLEACIDYAGEGEFLLERVEPGEPLASLADDAIATETAALAMLRLRLPPPQPRLWPTVEEWGRGFRRHWERFEGGSGPLPQYAFDRGEGLIAELLASAAPPALLHGDLHHWNLLRSGEDDWVAIDPKGVIGEPAYEPGALLRNRLPSSGDPAETRAILRRRIAILSEVMEIDAERIRAWAEAQAVLSAVWSVEDLGHGWEGAIACAERLAEVAV
jgi:streptomycin 6-kinase